MALIAPPTSTTTSEWLAFLTPISVALLTIVNLWAAKRAATKADLVATVAKQTAADAASKVATVAKVAADTAQQAQTQVAHITGLAEKTHTLVNSQYGIALRLILEKAIRIASLSKDPDDEAEVAVAKQKLAEHEAKQKVVDAADAAKADPQPDSAMLR